MTENAAGAGAASTGTERRPGSSRADAGTGRWRRLGAVAAGGTLVALGLRRRSAGGAALALAGGWLAARGVRGSAAVRSRTDGSPGEDERVDGPLGVGGRGATAERTVTVGAPADDLYERWRDPAQLSEFFGHVAEVTPAGPDRQRWTVRGPLDRPLSWETRLVAERPGELLRFEAVGGSPVAAEGAVRFRTAPADRGTEVTLAVRLLPPGGALGARAAERLRVVPAVAVETALRRCRSVVEAGEIPTLDRNPSARGRGDVV